MRNLFFLTAIVLSLSVTNSGSVLASGGAGSPADTRPEGGLDLERKARNICTAIKEHRRHLGKFLDSFLPEESSTLGMLSDFLEHRSKFLPPLHDEQKAWDYALALMTQEAAKKGLILSLSADGGLCHLLSSHMRTVEGYEVRQAGMHFWIGTLPENFSVIRQDCRPIGCFTLESDITAHYAIKIGTGGTDEELRCLRPLISSFLKETR